MKAAEWTGKWKHKQGKLRGLTIRTAEWPRAQHDADFVEFNDQLPDRHLRRVSGGSISQIVKNVIIASVHSAAVRLFVFSRPIMVEDSSELRRKLCGEEMKANT